MVEEKDKAVFRYLWFADETMEKVRVKAFLAHIFGSAASSCVTSFTLRHHADSLKEFFPENVVDCIRSNFYVDDGQGGDDQLEEAVKLKHNLVEAMRRGGFQLSKWKANHSSLLEPDVDGNVPEVEDVIVKVLGVHWNPKEDVFRFSMDIEGFNLPSKTPRELVVPFSIHKGSLRRSSF